MLTYQRIMLPMICIGTATIIHTFFCKKLSSSTSKFCPYKKMPPSPLAPARAEPAPASKYYIEAKDFGIVIS